jgi:hypothetical protein
MRYVEILAAATQWKKGMRILIKFDEDEAFLGTVSRVAADKISIKFDDDDSLTLPIKSKRILGIGVDKKRKSLVPMSKAKSFLVIEKPKPKEFKKVVKEDKKITKPKETTEVKPKKVKPKEDVTTKNVDINKLNISAKCTLDNWERFSKEFWEVCNKKIFSGKLSAPHFNLKKDMGSNVRTIYNVNKTKLGYTYLFAPKIFNNETVVRTCILECMAYQFVNEVGGLAFKDPIFRSMAKSMIQNVTYTKIDYDAIMTHKDKEKKAKLEDMENSSEPLYTYDKYTPCKFIGKDNKFMLGKIAAHSKTICVILGIELKYWQVNKDYVFKPDSEEVNIINRIPNSKVDKLEEIYLEKLKAKQQRKQNRYRF